MRRLLPFLLFFFLLAMRGLAAQSSPFPETVVIPASAISISLLALTVSIDVVAIGFVLSKLFPQVGIGDWLRDEYWEIAKSAMLIVSIFMVITLITNVSTLLVPISGAACPSSPSSQTANTVYALPNEACAYLSGVDTYLGSTYDYMLGLSSSLGALKSLEVSAFVPIPTPVVGFQTGFILKPYQNSMLEGSASGQFQSILNDAITLVAFPVSLITDIQLSALPFLFVLGISILIPLGLVMRALPFIRGIGGALVAVGLAVSVIYPSILVLLNYPVTLMLQSSIFTPQATCTAGIFCGIISTVLSYFPFATDAVASLNSILPALNSILNFNSYLTLQLVLFILDLGIGYSLANSIAHMLGGEIRLSIGGKLKLA